MTTFTGAIPTGLAASRSVKQGSQRRVYRPAYLARLTIRLDDGAPDGEVDLVREADAGRPAEYRVAKSALSAAQKRAVARAGGEVNVTADAAALVAAKRAVTPGGHTFAPPFGVSRDDQSIELTVVPLEVGLALNSFRIADKLAMVTSFADVPLIPEVVRSLLIDVYAGTVLAEDFGDPSRWIPRLVTTAPVFRGYADDVEVLGNETDLRMTINARSLEARLMEKKINPMTRERRVAHGGESTASYVKRLLSTVPEFSGALGDTMGVVFYPNVAPGKEPRLDAKLFNRSLQSAQSRAQAAGNVQGLATVATGADPAADPSNGTPTIAPATPNPTAEVSVWDMIVRACELSGMIPLYDPSITALGADGRPVMLGANNLLIVPPQNLKAPPSGGTTVPGGPLDGFSRTFSSSGRAVRSDVRLFVWAHNIKEMRLKRKYGRNKRPRVRVVSYNPDGPPAKRTLTVFFPDAPRGTSVSALGIAKPGGVAGHQPVEEEVVREIRGVRDLDRLKQIAVAIWHQIGGKEQGCVLETDELASYMDATSAETENESPDVLQLRAGSPVRVLVGSQVRDDGAPQHVSTLSDFMDRRPHPGAIRRALLDGPGAARALSDAGRARLLDAVDKIDRAYASAHLTDFFYTRCVEHRWTPDEGWSATIELSNYVRADLPANMTTADRAANDAVRASSNTASGHAAAIDAAVARAADAALRDKL